MESKRIQCFVCGAIFKNKIPRSHLELEHNMSVKMYKEKHGPTTVKQMDELVRQKNSPQDLVKYALATEDYRLQEQFYAEMGRRSVMQVFGEQMTNNVLKNVLMMMNDRIESYFRSAAITKKVQEEFLNSPWRFEMDEKGRTIPNKELLRIMSYMNTDTSQSLKGLMDLLSNIVQDNKSVIGKSLESGVEAFSGEYDKAQVPDSFNSQKREKLRLMLEDTDTMSEDDLKKFVALLKDEQVEEEEPGEIKPLLEIVDGQEKT